MNKFGKVLRLCCEKFTLVGCIITLVVKQVLSFYLKEIEQLKLFELLLETKMGNATKCGLSKLNAKLISYWCHNK